MNAAVSAVNTYGLDGELLPDEYTCSGLMTEVVVRNRHRLGKLSSRSDTSASLDSQVDACVLTVAWPTSQEYPNSEGAGNPHSPSDAANLLSFFKALRTGLGSSKIISAAVPHLPWLGSDGKPLTNVASYADELTYLNIM